MDQLPQAIRRALEFEQHDWANGNVADSDFYKCPPYSPQDPAGKLLRLEETTDVSKYHLMESMAMSRLIYLSEKLDGTKVPVSAYILWPYTPRTRPDGKYAVIAWAHGTSGPAATAAPSNLKNLLQHFMCPYQLALNGYVVVATDYAGLGVSHDVHGKPIVHEYLVHPAHANDVAYAVQAATSAFPSLSDDWVAIGHSQGGGAAWAVAERQASKPVMNLLGSAPVAPAIHTGEENDGVAAMLLVVMSLSMKDQNPGLDVGQFLTDEGMRCAAVIPELGVRTSACWMIMQSGANVAQPGWRSNKDVVAHLDKSRCGRRAIGCPMFVVYGEADDLLGVDGPKRIVSETRAAFPANDIDILAIPGSGHNPCLSASQPAWMDWIAARFEDKPFGGNASVVAKTARPLDAYVTKQNWYMAHATESWHVP